VEKVSSIRRKGLRREPTRGWPLNELFVVWPPWALFLPRVGVLIGNAIRLKPELIAVAPMARLLHRTHLKEKSEWMRIRFFNDEGIGGPHIHKHEVQEFEVQEVLRQPGEDRPVEMDHAWP